MLYICYRHSLSISALTMNEPPCLRCIFVKYLCGDLRSHVISLLSILSICMYTTTSGYQADTTAVLNVLGHCF